MVHARRTPRRASCAAVRKACSWEESALSCHRPPASLSCQSRCQAQERGEGGRCTVPQTPCLPSPALPHPGLTLGIFINPTLQMRKLRPKGGSESYKATSRAGAWLVEDWPCSGCRDQHSLPSAPMQSHGPPYPTTGVAPPKPSCEAVEQVTEEPMGMSSVTSYLRIQSPSSPGEGTVQGSEVAAWAWGVTGQGSVQQPGSSEERLGGAQPTPPPCKERGQLPQTEPSEGNKSQQRRGQPQPRQLRNTETAVYQQLLCLPLPGQAGPSVSPSASAAPGEGADCCGN